jgi:long-chain acyl-CoA synthetase
VQPHTALQRVIATNIKEFFPMPLRIAFTVLKEKKGGHGINLKSGDSRFRDCLKARMLETTAAQPDAVAVMLLSGGTTGTPKMAVGRHRDLVAAGLQLQAWLDRKPDDVALVPLPLFHVYACVGAQSHAIVSRTPLAIVPNARDLDDLLNTIVRVKPTLFSCVPALFIAMLNHPRVTSKRVSFSSIRASFSGSAPLMAATKQRFESLTGGRIVEGYSLTEAMMACVINPLEGVNKIGSVGLPLPDVEIAVVDPSNPDEMLPPGATGEVLIRAPQLMAGYLNDALETSRTLRSHGDGGPWLHTGDLGYLDEDSYLFIVDRQKDLIKTSGLQVWPREVEEAIASHPAVAEVGVAGVADAIKGEAVKAWVVCHPSATVTVGELRRHCRDRLAPFKVPSHIEFRESLPKTMTGKVLRRALKAEQP